MFQDSDLKQYLDHCGNLMSMHNVKVRASTHLGAHLFSSPGRELKVLAAEVVQTFKCRREGRGSAIQGGPEPWSAAPPRPALQTHTPCHCPAVDVKPRSLTLSISFPCVRWMQGTSQGEGRLPGKVRGMNGLF